MIIYDNQGHIMDYVTRKIQQLPILKCNKNSVMHIGYLCTSSGKGNWAPCPFNVILSSFGVEKTIIFLRENRIGSLSIR